MEQKPQAIRREEATQAILRAAADHFAEFGFDGASLNTIADLSGCSKQRLLYYFDSKDQLWRAATDWVFGRVEEEFAAALHDARENEGLNAAGLMRAHARIAARHPAYILIPLAEGVRDTWRTRYIIDNYLKAHHARFKSLATKISDLPRANDIDAWSLQLLAAGGVQLMVALKPMWQAAGMMTSLEERVEGYSDMIMTLLSEEK
ncbi:MAG: TetR/AcrR family transcriptional regulator [Pseudomonadota bacterium]